MNTVIAKPLPRYAKVANALSRSAVYAGTLAVANLPRLKEAVAGSGGVLDISLGFSRDRQRGAMLSGTIDGTLSLQCQRCLQAFEWLVHAPVSLRLVFSEEEENRVMQDAEPYRVEDDILQLHEVVEEEVLLALPIAPRCEREDCSGA